MRRVALALLVVLIVAQLVPVARTNPPATSELTAPLEIDGLLQRACYDCHSNETRWPWYGYVAPVSWLLAWDVHEARKHLNFSTWGDNPPGKQRKKLQELVEMIEEDEMPLWYYRPFHPDAQLSRDERDRLIAWAREWSATPTADTNLPRPRPTFADVPYGPDPRQVLDFWKADTREPAPLMLYVHGGSWIGGSKDGVAGLEQVLAAGISVASIEYRLVRKATLAGARPPVAWPMRDVARALQFVRSKAAEWEVDKTRICVLGNSAGGCSGLWLAFHDDMADPSSSDPVARESTRLSCAAGISAQTTLDPAQMRAWIPNIDYGGHAFGVGPDRSQGLTRFENFLAQRQQLLPWIREYSPIALVTPDDPPVYLSYITKPALGQPQAQPEHSANFGAALQRKLASVGVECVLVHPQAPSLAYPHPHDFVIAKLRPSGRERGTTNEAPR